ncbi:MAG: DUF2599 domain-containing protein [Eubacteriales bacterium]|nr:DUF2599 domain-containing protein [Eubacteriales bacterium]
MKKVEVLLTLVLIVVLAVPCVATERSIPEQINDASNNEFTNLKVIEKRDNLKINAESQTVNIARKDFSQVKVNFTSDYDRKKYEIGIKLPIKKNAQTRVEQDNIISDEEKYSVVTEAFEDGVQINIVIKDENAPEKFALKYNLPEGFSIRFAEVNGEKDGSVEIVNKEGVPIGAIAIPWAKDVNGKKVPTYYEIKENKLYQIVKHKSAGATYPIVADPHNKYSDWFKSATWKIRDGKYSLCVVPTKWNRQSGIAYMSTSWALLKKKKSGSKHWYNTEGLRKQYYCHTQAAKFKSSWNLEPWRPNVSMAKTIAKACNPT